MPAQLVGLGVGDPVGLARGRLGGLRAEQAVDEVARCRPSTAAGCRRRRAGSGPCGPRRRTGTDGAGWYGPVEPRRPADHASAGRPARTRPGRAARPRASTSRSPGTGWTGESLGEAVRRSGVGTERRVRRHVHEPGAAPARRARSSTSCGAADVHVEERPGPALGVDHPGGMEHGRAAHALEQARRAWRGRARRRRRSPRCGRPARAAGPRRRRGRGSGRAPARGRGRGPGSGRASRRHR